jgi:prophage antirepressor-like protein
MKSEISVFKFQNRDVRVSVQDGDPWFVAKDVCDVLGLGNSRQAIANLDEDEKGVINNDTPGGNQKMATVSESGLYALIFQSRKPQAKAFRKWVTSKVLPQIRKTGGYIPDYNGDALTVIGYIRLLQKRVKELETIPNRLTDKERIIIISLYRSGYSLADISRITGRSRPVVSTVIRQAKDKLRSNTMATVMDSWLEERMRLFELDDEK